MRPEDFLPGYVTMDRSNPRHPAGTDSRNLTALLQLEHERRGRHGDTTTGASKWPRR